VSGAVEEKDKEKRHGIVASAMHPFLLKVEMQSFEVGCKLISPIACKHGYLALAQRLNEGLARTIYVYIYIYGVYTTFLAGKSPNIRCIYTVLANSSHDCMKTHAKW